MSGTERQPAEDPEFRRLGTCADVVIKAALVACGASVVVCLNAYGLRPESYLLSALSPVLDHALAAIGLLLLLSLKLRTHVRIGVAITIVMAAVGLYTLEGLLTWFGGADRLLRQSGVLAATAGVEFDTRDRLAVLASLERRGLPAVPNINPANVLRADGNGLLTSTLEIEDVEILPLAGISMKRTLYCNESGHMRSDESDEHGFHNPRGLWSASRIDVAAVGDSFVQGSCVPSEQNIMGIIQRAHPLALNLGMVNGPLAALATLKEYVPPLKPAIVLWFYFEGNDLEDLARERRTPKLTSYLQGGFTQQLARQQAEIDRALTRYVDAARVAGEQQRRYGHPAGLVRGAHAGGEARESAREAGVCLPRAQAGSGAAREYGAVHAHPGGGEGMCRNLEWQALLRLSSGVAALLASESRERPARRGVENGEVCGHSRH